MEKTSKSFQEYIQSLDPQKQDTMIELDHLLSTRFGEENRSVWEGTFWGGSSQKIVGYGDYQVKRSDKQISEWFMVGAAVQKNYFSLYFNAVEDNQYLVKKYADSLGKVKIGSSSISFSKLENLNRDTLEKIIDISYNQWKN